MDLNTAWRARRDLFPGLPTLARNALIRGGYRSPGQAAAASDEALLHCQGFGRQSLATVRRLYGGPPRAPRACPHCGGDLTDWEG